MYIIVVAHGLLLLNKLRIFEFGLVFTKISRPKEKQRITHLLAYLYLCYWNLRTGFMNIDIFNKKVQYLNDGNNVFPWTHLSSIGTAVAGVLSKPRETENRNCYISSTLKSQKQMTALAKERLGPDGWEESHQDVEKALKEAPGNMMAGTVNIQVMGDMIRSSCTVYTPR